MKISILGKTSTETGTMIWAADGDTEYGIGDDFNVDTLMTGEDGDYSNCDDVDSDSVAHYREIASAIKDAASSTNIGWI